MRVYKITPIPKPRMTQSDKWKKRDCVLRYRAFKDEVRLNHVMVNPCGSQIIFNIPMPKSWSEKKKVIYDGKPHQQTPDIDNLAKALFDAIFDDDSHIYQCSIEKRWGRSGSIEITQAGQNTKELT